MSWQLAAVWALVALLRVMAELALDPPAAGAWRGLLVDAAATSIGWLLVTPILTHAARRARPSRIGWGRAAAVVIGAGLTSMAVASTIRVGIDVAAGVRTGLPGLTAILLFDSEPS